MGTATQLEAGFIEIIAGEIGCHSRQVKAADALLAEGATVPFIARYRKEATGGLSDEHLEVIDKRRGYFLELTERRNAVLESIAGQGKLTPELESAIGSAITKQELEDIYLPYKPKRRTRAQIAREKGLEPLADALLEAAGGETAPEEIASPFVDPQKGVETPDSALTGGRDILAERLAESADNRSALRSVMASEARLEARCMTGKEEEGAVYRDYFNFSEPAAQIPSHRFLAIMRGEQEGILSSSITIDDQREIDRLAGTWGVPLDTPCGRIVAEASMDGYKRLLRPSISNEVRSDLRERAEAEAISVFRANLEALLMQAPYGQLPVMGLDPGYRTGCKLAVVEDTGRVAATAVIHPIPPKADLKGAAETLRNLIEEHRVRAVAIGNGTGSRETELFVRKAVEDAGLKKVVVVIVPETGASVYSASNVAREELPELDVALRGAASIARRMQDPLAELVKIEPRSMGVGQYQHDVNQKALEKELDLAVERVVNRVGVELNSASASLLRRVSGLSERLANTLVKHRDGHGRFTSRRSLMEVSGLGPKAFEQAAGFLRIRGADNPLDSTAVHPERYPLVEKMAGELTVPLDELVGNPELIGRLDLSRFLDEEQGIGRFTLEDIRNELEKPGRDPRPQFEAPRWSDDVQTIEDLQEGMTLEGRVSNVTNFGAFVDIGVKRDGLVHLSELSNRWVDDPRKVVQVGQVVRVKVKEIDLERGRIGLSMKALETAAKSSQKHHPAPKKRAKPKYTAQDLARKFNRHS